jgi:hypothetical protein
MRAGGRGRDSLEAGRDGGHHHGPMKWRDAARILRGHGCRLVTLVHNGSLGLLAEQAVPVVLSTTAAREQMWLHFRPIRRWCRHFFSSFGRCAPAYDTQLVREVRRPGRFDESLRNVVHLDRSVTLQGCAEQSRDRYLAQRRPSPAEAAVIAPRAPGSRRLFAAAAAAAETRLT